MVRATWEACPAPPAHGSRPGPAAHVAYRVLSFIGLGLGLLLLGSAWVFFRLQSADDEETAA